MSEEEKYDELIRQKFAEKEFMFNEANWEKAEAMIDASRKTKKIFLWSAVFLIGLITGIFLMLPLIKNNSSHPINEPAKLNTSSNVTDSSTTFQSDKTTTGKKSAHGSSSYVGTESQTIAENKEINTVATTNETNFKTARDHSDDNSNEALAKNKSTGNVLNGQPQKKKFSTALMAENDSKNTGQHLAIHTSIKSEKNSTQTQPAETNTGELSTGNTVSGSLPQQKKEKGKEISRKEKDALASAQEKNITKDAKDRTSQKNADITANTNEETTKDESDKPEAEKTGLSKKDTPVAAPSDSTNLENKPADELIAKVDALNDSTKQEEKKLAETDSIQKADSVKATTADKAAPPALDGLASATYLSVDAGINGHLGWKNNDQIEGRGITPILGFGITHAFNQTWSVSSGVQYNGISYLREDSRTVKNTTYDFGSTTITTTTKPHFLHYLTVPLTIQYHFNDKNAILAGGTFAYLLNAKNKVEESTTRVGPIVDTTTAQISSNDYVAKIANPYDAVIGIGYRRKISSQFSITAIANFGLLDIKRNSFFMQNSIERNSGLRVVLSYTIFDY